MSEHEEEGKALYEAHMAASRSVYGDAFSNPIVEWVGLDDAQRMIWRMTAIARGPGIEGEIESLPNSRERSLAKTKVEEARLWMTKAPRFEVTP